MLLLHFGLQYVSEDEDVFTLLFFFMSPKDGPSKIVIFNRLNTIKSFIQELIIYAFIHVCIDL